jgi:hypothetical protein
MSDDTTSVTAALVGPAGFEVLAAADAGGEVEVLVQATADLVDCPVLRGGSAGERPPPDVGARPSDRRPAGGGVLGEARLVVPASGV